MEPTEEVIEIGTPSTPLTKEVYDSLPKRPGAPERIVGQPGPIGNPVSYTVLDHWPEEYIEVPKRVGGPGGFDARQRVMCAWADRWTLAEEFWLTGWPYATTVPPCVAVSIRMRPLDSGPQEDGGVTKAKYTYAELDIGYTTNYLRNNRLITETLDFAVNGLSLNSNDFAWQDAPNVVTGSLPVIVDAPLLTYTYSVMNAPSIPSAAVSLVGCTNNAIMTAYSWGLNFDVECLLYLGCRLSKTIVIGSRTSLAYSYTFHARGASWNKFFRSSDVSYQYYVLRGTSTVFKPYPPADLSALFV